MSKRVSIFLSVFIVVISGMWIWTILMPRNFVILGGSTSVNPFMQVYTTNFVREEGTDFIFNSTGSQAGVNGVENGMYSAGFISREASAINTLSPENSFFNFQREDNNIIYEIGEAKNFIDDMTGAADYVIENNISTSQAFVAFEFAVDPLLIIYNAPNWFIEAGLNDRLNFEINREEPSSTVLGKIFNNDFTWEELALSLGDEQTRTSNTSFNLFSRESGSGTRSAFQDITGIRQMETANIIGSNGGMLATIRSTENSIGFLSFAFLEQINSDFNVRIAGIDGIRLGNPIDETMGYAMFWDENEQKFVVDDNNITNESVIRDGSYIFQRPFIAIFNLQTNRLQELINFFAVLISYNETQQPWVESTFQDNGLVPSFVIKHLQ